MALNGHLSLQGLCFLLLSTVLSGQALELRLKDGGHFCEGRVEVKHQGEWGTVNDYQWSLEEAAVVCRQLQCGVAVDAPRGAYFGPGVGPIWLLHASCEGTESAVSDCRHSAITDYRDYSLSHDWDAGAVCSETRPESNPVPGIFFLLGILCLILGPLLFLVLIILMTQLLRRREEQRALPSVEDALAEAVYEELDYIMTAKEDLPGSTVGFPSDDSVTKLPHYTGDSEDHGDYRSAADERADAPGEGYDDAEEVPVPGAPPAPQGIEGEVPPVKENGMRASQTGSSLHFSREVTDTGKGEESPRLLQEERGDAEYDDVELSAPGTAMVAFP